MEEAKSEDSVAAGREARAEAPRSSHAEWEPPAGRDPIALLEEQAASRVQELIPLRYGRMAASPFAFFRGAAYLMAADLAASPHSGFRVQLCGDAHLANFGGFGSPERSLVFDLNDFDETLPGPWEWDVKRLAASVGVAARERGISRKQRRALIRDAVAEYRKALAGFAEMPALEVWYSRVDERAIQGLETRLDGKQLEKTLAKARSKDSARAFEKLTHRVNGTTRIVADPPLIVPIEDLLPGEEAERLEEAIRELIESYRKNLPPDRRRLLDRYSYAHLARKVVGVGSVGTRAWIMLMTGRDNGDPLFLQAKEAQRSVLEPFAGASEFDNQGQRVVEGQRLVQAASDILLGWLRTTGIDGEQRDFYVRQLWDWKTSADLETIRPRRLEVYAKLCAWTLARAHARSGDAVSIAAYLGKSRKFDDAVTEFSELYADQNERDHDALLQAIDDGRVPAAV